jgi:hypothetical protein
VGELASLRADVERLTAERELYCELYLRMLENGAGRLPARRSRARRRSIGRQLASVDAACPTASIAAARCSWLTSGPQRNVVISWALFSGLAVLWDFSWCFVAHALQRPDLGGWWRVWTLYGQIDRRYLQSDPWLFILEVMTGIFCTTLNYYFVHQLLRKREQRARVALLVVSVMEVYGTVMYFGSELCSGLRHVDRSSVVAMIVFFGLNSLWLVFPGWCIYHLAYDYAATDSRQHSATRNALTGRAVA